MGFRNVIADFKKNICFLNVTVTVTIANVLTNTTKSEHDPPNHQAATAALRASVRRCPFVDHGCGPRVWSGVCVTTQGLGACRVVVMGHGSWVMGQDVFWKSKCVF